jgi:hypothetical protein
MTSLRYHKVRINTSAHLHRGCRDFSIQINKKTSLTSEIMRFAQWETVYFALIKNSYASMVSRNSKVFEF